jgi:hypothetical protein
VVGSAEGCGVAVTIGLVVGSVAAVVAAGVAEATPRPRTTKIAPQPSSETISPIATAGAYALDRRVESAAGVGASDCEGKGEIDVEGEA